MLSQTVHISGNKEENRKLDNKKEKKTHEIHEILQKSFC